MEGNNSGVCGLKLMGQLCSEIISGSGQISCSSVMRCNEHAWHVHLYQLNKLAVREHSIETECQISRTHHSTGKNNGLHGLLSEGNCSASATPQEFNRDSGFGLSSSWYLAMGMIKQVRVIRKYCNKGPA
jgi:hypothetical protein